MLKRKFTATGIVLLSAAILCLLACPRARAAGISGGDALRTIAILENERVLKPAGGQELAKFFESGDPLIRARAVLAAARVGSASAIRPLTPLASDPVVEVRRNCAFALGQIRSKAGVPLLRRLLNDSDREVRRLGIEAAGRIGGVDMTRFILPFLDDREVVIREQAALALALIKDRATVDPLIERAGKDDPAQWSYVYALYRLADSRSIPALHSVISHPSASPSTGEPSSLLFALKGLWAMKSKLSKDELSSLLRHPDLRVQVNALDTAGAGADAGACEIMAAEYGNMTLMARWKAIEASGQLGCPIDGFPMHSNATLDGARLLAVAKVRKQAAVPELQDAAAGTSWIMRWRCAQALADMEAESAVPLLKRLAGDQDKAVQSAALESLENFIPGDADFFLPLLKSPDFVSRSIAVDAIGKTGDAGYVPQLVDCYNRSVKEAGGIDTPLAVIDALANFADSRALPVYRQALVHPEYLMRKHAVDAVKKASGEAFCEDDDQVRQPDGYLDRQSAVPADRARSYPADFGKEEAPDYLAEITLAAKGTILIRLHGKEAPLHVLNFKRLADSGFYDGLRIHRVVPNFVIQGGDPRGDGWGSAGELVHDQFNALPFRRGSVGMPTSGKDTGGSQFFITMSRQPHLDGNYTLFGTVISGMEVVDATEVGDTIVKVVVRRP